MRGNIRVHEPKIPLDPPVCFAHKAVGKIGKLDGDLNKPFWQTGEWMDSFFDIEGDPALAPTKRTLVKVLWDEDALYVGAQVFDDTIWATVFDRDEIIYVDNDFEIFLAPKDTSHRYYEIELNAANAVWDLFMERPQRDFARRIIAWDIKGLESAVKIDGRLNDPSADNKSWSFEMKIPWFSLRECSAEECLPGKLAPDIGEIWRMTFSRVEWDVEVKDGKYQKLLDENGQPLPEHNWLWSPTGVYDAHIPEMWGYLVFTNTGEEYPLPIEDKAKFVLRKLYYRQHAYCCKNGCFCADAVMLLGDEAKKWGVTTFVTPSLFEGILTFEGKTYHIDQDGYLWEGEKY